MNQYETSFYNQLMQIEGKTYIYNALSGFKAKITEELLKDQIKKLIDGEKFDEASIDKRLINSKLAVISQEAERQKAIIDIRESITKNFDYLRLIILPTRECNFRCIYCYEDKRNEFMTDRTIEFLLASVKEHIISNKIKYLCIEWFGGEPMLSYDNIVRISKILKDFCNKNSVLYQMTMTSNGYLLTKERAKALFDLNLDKLQITIDCNEEYHDKLRPTINGKPTFKRILDNLLKLKELPHRFKVILRTNYCWDMFKDIEEYLIRMKELFGDDARFVFYLIKINKPKECDSKFDFVENQEEAGAIVYMLDLYKKLGLDIDVYSSHLSPVSAICYARMNGIFVIDTDGSIRKCTEYLEDNNINYLGNIEDGFKSINNLKHEKWFFPSEEILQEKGCHACKDFPTCCGGVCSVPWLKNNTTYCNLYRSFNDELLELYFRQKDCE